MSTAAKPRYQQLKDQIINRIVNGELQPADRVPSEHDLVKSAGVSRMTANRALRELNDEGYVDRVAGIGTFVADLKAESHLFEVRDIADEVASRGNAHRSHVLASAIETSIEEVAYQLQVDAGTDCNHIRLLHFENDTPIQIEDRYVAMSFAPKFARQSFRDITPSAYLNSIAPLQEFEHVVSAEMPTSNMRQDLRLGSQEPCLVVTRRTWVRSMPVSFARLYHPGSRFELVGHRVPPGTTKSI